MKRRDVLRGALATPFLFSTVGCASLFRSSKNPFSLGVASGSPAPDGFVIWTRLAPDPLQPDGGMGNKAVAVKWEVAEDEGFKKIVKSGEAPARPELAHAVHAEVAGLKPDRWYFYRFHAGDATTPVARTRTTPAIGAAASNMRFAFGSCANYVYGYWDAYRQMAQDNLDLVVWLGDYIYEEGAEQKEGYLRQHVGPECRTLADYRQRYSQYKMEPHLQAVHAVTPWLLMWDDHEVGNGWANDRTDFEVGKPVLDRRAAAFQAYFEHQPLRPSRVLAAVGKPEMRIYGQTQWGSLANFFITDVRQHRDYQVCHKSKDPKKIGGNTLVGDECTERNDPKRTNLGAHQEKWLFDAMGASKSRWNIMGTYTSFSQLDYNFEGGQDEKKMRNDSWDGYTACRKRITDTIVDSKLSNPVIIGGDLHTSFVFDVKPDYTNPKSPVIGTEFVTTSISSRGPGWSKQKDAIVAEVVKKNSPHMKWGQVEKRGYTMMEVTPGKTEVSMRHVQDWRQNGSPVSTQKKFVILDGKPGAQEA